VRCPEEFGVQKEHIGIGSVQGLGSIHEGDLRLRGRIAWHFLRGFDWGLDKPVCDGIVDIVGEEIIHQLEDDLLY